MSATTGLSHWRLGLGLVTSTSLACQAKHWQYTGHYGYFYILCVSGVILDGGRGQVDRG